MHLECIESVKSHFLNDSFVNGFFFGLDNFASFATYSAVFFTSKCFLTNTEPNGLTPGKMIIVIGLINTCTQGITNSKGTLGVLKRQLQLSNLYIVL